MAEDKPMLCPFPFATPQMIASARKVVLYIRREGRKKWFCRCPNLHFPEESGDSREFASTKCIHTFTVYIRQQRELGLPVAWKFDGIDPPGPGVEVLPIMVS